MKAIVEEEGLRPSSVVTSAEAAAAAEKRAATPEELCRSLRGDLDTIVSKALKKNPQERYNSVTALADDLWRYLREEPISARPDTVVYRASKFMRRNRLAVGLTTLAVITTLAGLLGTITMARTARRQRDFALRQLNHANAINEFNEFILSDASGKTFTTKDLLEHAMHILERQSPSDTNVELLASLGFQYSLLGEQEKATHILEKAYRLSESALDPEVRATAACEFAGALVQSGDLDRAESLFQKGIRELPDEPQFAIDRVECLHRGSEVARERGDLQLGLTRMEQAREVLQNSSSGSDFMQVDILTDLGEAYRMSGQVYEASLLFEKVNGLLVSMGRDQTRTAGVLYNDWGLALERLGRPLEAERLMRKSIELQGAGMEAIGFNNYAIVLRDLGRLPEARDYSEKSYLKAQQTGDEFTIYRALYFGALVQIDLKDFRRAGTMLQQVDPIIRRKFPPDHMWFGLVVSSQALVEAGNGNVQKASTLADEGVAIYEAASKKGKAPVDFLASLLIRRATVELTAGNPAAAEADAGRAIGLYQSVLPPGALSSHVGQAYLKLGIALQAENKTNEARNAFRSAAEHLLARLGADHPDTRQARQAAGLELNQQTSLNR